MHLELVKWIIINSNVVEYYIKTENAIACALKMKEVTWLGGDIYLDVAILDEIIIWSSAFICKRSSSWHLYHCVCSLCVLPSWIKKSFGRPIWRWIVLVWSCSSQYVLCGSLEKLYHAINVAENVPIFVAPGSFVLVVSTTWRRGSLISDRNHGWDHIGIQYEYIQIMICINSSTISSPIGFIWV